jgi:hypothetical protein
MKPHSATRRLAAIPPPVSAQPVASSFDTAANLNFNLLT